MARRRRDRKFVYRETYATKIEDTLTVIPMTPPDLALRTALASRTLITRTVAWAALILVVLLTLVPPNVRPRSILPHGVEHFAAFLLMGAAIAIGYRRHHRMIAILAIPVTALLELAQICVPGRHASFTDFAINALGICVGVALISLIARRRLNGEGD